MYSCLLPFVSFWDLYSSKNSCENIFFIILINCIIYFQRLVVPWWYFGSIGLVVCRLRSVGRTENNKHYKLQRLIHLKNNQNKRVILHNIRMVFEKRSKIFVNWKSWKRHTTNLCWFQFHTSRFYINVGTIFNCVALF